MHVYFQHDTTVNAWLTILGAYNRVNPPFASVVLLELHQRKGSWELEVRGVPIGAVQQFLNLFC